jgi:hypothetical protein
MVQLLEHTGIAPFLKPVVRRRAGADARGVERSPLTPGPQDEQDAVQAVSIGPPPKRCVFTRSGSSVWKNSKNASDTTNLFVPIASLHAQAPLPEQLSAHEGFFG